MIDLIKREDAIKATWQEPTYTDPLNVLTEVRDRIEAIPSADRPQGEWIYPTDIVGFGRCNNCKALWDKSLIDNIYFKYCPRCGARMKGEDDE